jgi:hypothetical protein
LLPLPISNVVKRSEGFPPYVRLKPGIFEYRAHDFSISFTESNVRNSVDFHALYDSAPLFITGVL